MIVALEDRAIAIAVVGLGTVGKRVARAIELQPDMRLAGVAVRSPVAALGPVLERRTKVYCTSEPDDLARSGVRVEGRLQDLLKLSDVVVDCTPRGGAAARLRAYREFGVKVVIQGGEDADAADTDFCSNVNYTDAVGAEIVRVVSCNTTGVARLIAALETVAPIVRVRGVLSRSACDADKPRKGHPASALADMGRSHHGRDLQRLFPHIDISTMASSVPTNTGHLVQLFVEFASLVSQADVLDALTGARRVAVLTSGPGLTSDTRRVAPDGRDCHSVVVWRDSLDLQKAELALSAAIHMEAIVVPDTVDAIRALSTGRSWDASMSQTDSALGIV